VSIRALRKSIINMNELTVILDASRESDQLAEMSAEFALKLGYKLHFVRLQQTPSSWNILTRSTKAKYPAIINAINTARTQMDQYLQRYRNAGIKARKSIFYIEEDVTFNPAELGPLLLGRKKYMAEEGLNKAVMEAYYKENYGAVMLANDDFDPKDLDDVILLSEFEDLKSSTEEMVLSWSEKLNFRLNLLFINTLDKFESSTSSIAKMKRSINKGGFSNTKMTVFNAISSLDGARDYTQMQNCDLLIVENNGEPIAEFSKELDTNLLFIV